MIKLPLRLLVVLSFTAGLFWMGPLTGAFAQAADDTVVSGDSIAPDAFVSNLLDELREISAASGSDRTDGIRRVLLRSMAVSRMQAFLIRGDVEASASSEQMSQYEALFSEYIAAAIGDSIDRMVDRRIDIGEPRENKRRRGDFIVPAKIFSDEGEERATLGWRVQERRGRFLMIDFTIDGLSFSVERKAQFTSLVKNDGFSALLEHMIETIDG
ncbi:MAG: ABC transporter substrate-binding protein [Hyphomonadaceae bacterium]